MIGRLDKLGSVFVFGFRAMVSVPRRWVDWRELFHQIYYVGVLSIPIIIITAVSLGFVLTLLSYYATVFINSQESVGRFIAGGIMREMAPIIGGLVFIGRAASSTTAELGLMKVSDQIASLEMIGVDVWRHVYFPRFWAIVLTFPMLVVIFSFMGLMGAYWYSVYNLNLDGGYFWSVMNEHLFVSFDVFMLMIKGISFPFIIAVLTLFFGTHLKPTPIALSLASTKTVVLSAGSILVMDYIVTAIITGSWLP